MPDDEIPEDEVVMPEPDDSGTVSDIPALPPMVAPLAESENLDDLLNEDGSIK